MSIQVRALKKRYGTVVALDDVSFDVPSGSLTALLGASGSGKSTLLRVIAGLEALDEGTVLLNGDDVAQSAPQTRGIGFVFQNYALFSHMTVWDNVAFALQVRGRPRTEIRSRVDELLTLMQLDALGQRYPAQLSGGQQQRVAVARALAARPSVLLLDEPFAALDPAIKQEVRGWLLRLQAELHQTTLLVTHDHQEAVELADRLVVIDKGRLQHVGSRAVYEGPADPSLSDFIAADGGLQRRSFTWNATRMPLEAAT